MVPNPPATLVDHLLEDRCVLFAGSGLSAQAGLPTWWRLLETMVEAVEGDSVDGVPQEVTDLLERGKLLEVADFCKGRLGGRRYAELLAEHLRGTDGELPEAHRLLPGIPFSGIVTTNYDRLLERAYAAVGSWPKTPTHRDVEILGQQLFSGGFFILKAHGDVDRTETIVLTHGDYQELIHANPAFQAFFSALLLTRSLLFVGYSLSDPDFRLLLEGSLLRFRGYIPERYALMSGVGKIERDFLFRTTGVRVLPYETPGGDHREVLEFLRELSAAVQEAARGREAARDEEEEAAPRRGPDIPALRRPRRRSYADLLGEEAFTAGDRGAPAGRTVEVPEAVSPREVTPAPAAPPTAVLEIGFSDGQLAAALRREGGQAVMGRSPLPGWEALRPPAPGHRHAAQTYQEWPGRLAELLPQPVRRALAELPAGEWISLALSLEVEPIPWELLAVDGEPLCLRHPLTRAPIGVSDQARGYPRLASPLRVLLVGDSAGDLPGALEEVEEIAALYEDESDAEVETLLGQEASYTRLARRLRQGGFNLVHYAGHGWADAQDAYLVLAGWETLRSQEARSLLSAHPPALLFLNSHFTAFVPLGTDPGQRPGASGDAAQEESFTGTGSGRVGFTETATTAGVGAFVGVAGSPSDQGARRLAVAFHRRLLAGLPVAEALYQARREAAGHSAGESSGDPTWMLYTLSGRPELRCR